MILDLVYGDRRELKLKLIQPKLLYFAQNIMHTTAKENQLYVTGLWRLDKK